MEWSDLNYAGTADEVAHFALRVAEKFKGPRPELRLRVRGADGSTGLLTFTASVYEIRNVVPALDVKIVAELEADARSASHLRKDQ